MNAWIRRGLQVGVVSAGLLVASATGAAADGPDFDSHHNFGILNGVQANVPIQVPISVCGNGVGVLGKGEGHCEGGAKAKIKSNNNGPNFSSHHNFGILNGLQLNLPIQAPIDISGNGVGVLGKGEGHSHGGAEAIQ